MEVVIFLLYIRMDLIGDMAKIKVEY